MSQEILPADLQLAYESAVDVINATATLIATDHPADPLGNGHRLRGPWGVVDQFSAQSDGTDNVWNLAEELSDVATGPMPSIGDDKTSCWHVAVIERYGLVDACLDCAMEGPDRDYGAVEERWQSVRQWLDMFDIIDTDWVAERLLNEAALAAKARLDAFLNGTAVPINDKPSRRRGKKEEWEARALLLLKTHPDWEDKRIAAEIGKHPGNLSRSRVYQLAKTFIQGGDAIAIFRGWKTDAGDVEAIAD